MTFGDCIRLNHSYHNHYPKLAGGQTAHALNELDESLSTVGHRVNQYHSSLFLYVMQPDIVGTRRMNEHGLWKHIVDTKVIASPPRIKPTIEV
jgi:hypothetical protein